MSKSHFNYSIAAPGFKICLGDLIIENNNQIRHVLKAETPQGVVIECQGTLFTWIKFEDTSKILWNVQL